VTLVNAGNLDFQTSNVGRNLTATSTAGNITQSGPISAQSIDAVAVGGITLVDPGNVVAGFQANNTGGNILFSTNGNVASVGTITDTGGDVTLASTGNMTIGNAVFGTTGVNLNATGVDMIINHTAGVISTSNAAINLTADKMALAGGTINAGNATITLKPNKAGDAIDLGSVVDTTPATLELSNAELATLITTGSIVIGDNVTTGNVTVSAPVNIGASPANFNIINNTGTITFNSTLASAIDTNITSTAGNIVFGPAGAILAPLNNVALTALSGFVDGDPSVVPNFMAGHPLTNIAANNLTISAANGIGLNHPIDLAVNSVAIHDTTAGNVQLYSNGPISIAGVDNGVALTQTPGDFTLFSTGAVSETGPILTQNLFVTTFNTPGAAINLPLLTNHSIAFNLFACLALPLGCPPGGNPGALAPTWAAGGITYNDSGGSSVSGVGTVSFFTTYSAGALNFGPGTFAAQNVGIEASGNITFNGFTGLADPAINGGLPGGSLSFISGGSITYDPAPAAGSIGVAFGPFHHNLSFTAGGDITINGNIYLGANKFTALANQSFTDVNQTVVATGNGKIVLQGGTVTTQGAGGSIDLFGDNINGGALLATNTISYIASNGIGNLAPLNLQAQNVSAVTVAGDIDLNNTGLTPVVVTNLNTGAGNITFLQSAGGAVTFDTVTAPGIVSLSNTSGDLTVATAVKSTASNVLLNSSHNIILTGTTTAATIAQANATGSINGSGLVKGNTVKLFANTGVGNTTQVNTSTGQLFVNTGAGDIDVVNTFGGRVHINNLQTNNGSITFDQEGGGAVDFTNPVVATGNISITDKSSNLTVDQTITAGGNVTLAAGGLLSINSVVTGGTGITLTTMGAFDIDVNANVTTSAGPFVVNSGGNLAIVNGNMTTAGNMSLTAAGAIGETGTGIISASALTTSSASGTRLNNANTVNSLNASNTKSGNIEFTHHGITLSIAGISQAGGGDATITTDGSLSADGPLTVSGNGKLNLNAATGNITQSAGSVINTSFLVTATETGTFLTGVNQVGTFTGSNTGVGDIQLNNASDVLTLNGVTQTGTGNVVISNVTTDPKLAGQMVVAGTGINAGTGNVTLTASGNISQTTGGVQATVLNVSTLNDAGSNIDLSGSGNHATTVNLYACAAAGCTHNGISQYANGNIAYSDNGDTNINQVGTLGSFSAYAAGALNFTATTFAAHDATLEGLDVTFTNFVGLGNAQIGGGTSGTGFFDVIAGRDIVYDGVAAGGLIGTSTTPFSHDVNLTAGRDVLLGSSIYTGTGAFNISSGQDIKTANQTVLASTYTTGGDVLMYGNNQIESQGSIDITGRNFLIQGGATMAANPAGTYVNPNPQSGVGQQLIAADTINLTLSGNVTVQAGTATTISGSGAVVSANTVNIGSSKSPVQNIVIGGGNSTLTPSGNVVADATINANGDLNVYAAGNLTLTGGSVGGSAAAANQVQATAGANLTGSNVVINVTGDMTLQGGTVNADVPAPLLPTDPSSLASANALVNATNSKTITLGGNLVITGGDTSLSTKGSSVNALAIIDPGTLSIKTGGNITLTGGTGTGTDATIFGGGPMTFIIGGTTGVRLVGGTGSGVFDGTNARLDGSGYPVTLTFTSTTGNYKIIGDLTLGDAFIQSEASLALDSLTNLGIDSIDRSKTDRNVGFYSDASLLYVRSSVTTASSCK
jgi:hypothetical protein